MDGRKAGDGQREHRQDGLAERFETHRGQLRAVAYRMLGSTSEADDAVQETWLRLSRADAEAVGNLTGWLRTVVSRICLDMLRSRTARREEPVGQELPEPARETGDGGGPEDEAVLADSVGRALLVVLDTLGPAERVAFVLHDVFGVPFDRIAPIVERSPVAAKKLASRARQKVRGIATVPRTELDRQRRTVDAFLAAARGGDMAALLAVLDPDVVRRADRAALPEGVPTVARGARAVAEETAGFAPRARFAEPALVNGSVGVVVAPRGRLLLALTVTVEAGRIAAYEVIADPARLSRLELGLLDDVRPHVASAHG
ncbi:sigma-70 family RNA polymerase sigma factor [Streptomyces javensis]|uniref:Sigma-70 family RNA polymerase sigma factor n=1 Tax=Streptomyces javensis TaxID=114698 RepID=A0ABN1WNV9_9ACTN